LNYNIKTVNNKDGCIKERPIAIALIVNNSKERSAYFSYNERSCRSMQSLYWKYFEKKNSLWL